MAFPYDFGFVPSTNAEDGDGTDVLVRMDEPAFPGCLLRSASLGSWKVGKARRKLASATIASWLLKRPTTVMRTSELGKKFVKELEEFFVNYHDLQGEKCRILDRNGPSEAGHRIEDGSKNFCKDKS